MLKQMQLAKMLLAFSKSFKMNVMLVSDKYIMGEACAVQRRCSTMPTRTFAQFPLDENASLGLWRRWPSTTTSQLCPNGMRRVALDFHRRQQRPLLG
jgi:hypothetical protein